MHSKILCDVEIGPTVGCDGSQEGEIRHVLHGREKKSRAVGGDHGLIIPRQEREDCPV